MRYVNGMPVTDLGPVRWTKSRYSNAQGACVQLAELPDGERIAVSHSRDPYGPALIFTRAEILAFVLGARDGLFDQMT